MEDADETGPEENEERCYRCDRIFEIKDCHCQPTDFAELAARMRDLLTESVALSGDHVDGFHARLKKFRLEAAAVIANYDEALNG